MAEYIDKQAFNDAIREAVRKYPNTFYNGLEVARHIAHDMSAADVQPVRHGRWEFDGKPISFDENGCPVGSCFCSVCGDWLTASDEYATRGRYCPNCGALMDGGKA